ncbi:beta-N-acetylhexosaminidase [Nonomuraea sp. NPDC003727]
MISPLIPQVTSLIPGPGLFPLGHGTQVSGPHAGTARDLLGLESEGGGAGEITLHLVDDPSLGEEGYTLTVTPDEARIAAAGPAGLRWGVQTLRQLSGPGGVQCCTVRDVPRYTWRGVMIDVARWWRPISFLRAYVDLLALHKFNVLHLHLTDDQGWRFEVRGHPRLTEVGATRAESSAGHAREGRFDGTPHGGFYTQRGLVDYAADRGVTVVPEIEFPGHSQAAIAACPWLGHTPAEVRTSWGISSHVLNVSDRAAGFARDVLDELSEVFPSRFIHIGGDEVRSGEWASSPDALRRVASEGLAGPEALHGWWGRLLADHLRGLGCRAVAWDDMFDHDPPEDMVIMAWRGVNRRVPPHQGTFRLQRLPPPVRRRRGRLVLRQGPRRLHPAADRAPAAPRPAGRALPEARRRRSATCSPLNGNSRTGWPPPRRRWSPTSASWTATSSCSAPAARWGRAWSGLPGERWTPRDAAPPACTPCRAGRTTPPPRSWRSRASTWCATT